MGEEETSERGPGLYRVLAILFGLLAGTVVVLNSILEYGARAGSLTIPVLFGEFLGATVFFPAIVVGLVKLFSRSRFTARRGWKAAFYTLAVIFLLFLPQLAQVAVKRTQEAQAEQSLLSSAGDWTRFENAEFGFAADFPGEPTFNETEEALTYQLLVGKVAFTVVLQAIDETMDPTAIYDAVEEATRGHFADAEWESRAIFHEDRIGRELVLRQPAGEQDLVQWLIVQYGVLYRVNVNGVAPLDEGVARRFLASFTLDVDPAVQVGQQP